MRDGRKSESLRPRKCDEWHARNAHLFRLVQQLHKIATQIGLDSNTGPTTIRVA